MRSTHSSISTNRVSYVSDAARRGTCGTSALHSRQLCAGMGAAMRARIRSALLHTERTNSDVLVSQGVCASSSKQAP